MAPVVVVAGCGVGSLGLRSTVAMRQESGSTTARGGLSGRRLVVVELWRPLLSWAGPGAHGRSGRPAATLPLESQGLHEAEIASSWPEPAVARALDASAERTSSEVAAAEGCNMVAEPWLTL